jgi:hypothetical protein
VCVTNEKKHMMIKITITIYMRDVRVLNENEGNNGRINVFKFSEFIRLMASFTPQNNDQISKPTFGSICFLQQGIFFECQSGIWLLRMGGNKCDGNSTNSIKLEVSHIRKNFH